ncbi:MAG: hypothetical protein LBG80_18620 [Bacteroidales bacterium]|nr:hypothetical protein [Bacteroidales bacterium]
MKQMTIIDFMIAALSYAGLAGIQIWHNQFDNNLLSSNLFLFTLTLLFLFFIFAVIAVGIRYYRQKNYLSLTTTLTIPSKYSTTFLRKDKNKYVHSNSDFSYLRHSIYWLCKTNFDRFLP